MAYSELIKNFEKVRAYMREFYVYGFKSRTEYDAKSARSYTDAVGLEFCSANRKTGGKQNGSRTSDFEKRQVLRRAEL